MTLTPEDIETIVELHRETDGFLLRMMSLVRDRKLGFSVGSVRKYGTDRGLSFKKEADIVPPLIKRFYADGLTDRDQIIARLNEELDPYVVNEDYVKRAMKQLGLKAPNPRHREDYRGQISCAEANRVKRTRNEDRSRYAFAEMP